MQDLVNKVSARFGESHTSCDSNRNTDTNNRDDVSVPQEHDISCQDLICVGGDNNDKEK